jgi:HD-GYP domain-containing protein (c-di-GMP phosphodiesterase class II)
LERDDVARLEAGVAEDRDQAERVGVDIGVRAVPRPGLGPDVHAGIRRRAQAPIDESTEGLISPPPLGEIARPELGRDRPTRPSLVVRHAHPPHPQRRTTLAGLDGLAKAFASVIDAKSPYTCDHSRRVADYASAIGMRLGFEGELLVRLRRAALLHDIGKLGVPNRILDKPGRLTAEEWQVVRQHPKHTLSILSSVPVFREFAFDAACHHEKLDGTGYHAGLLSRELSLTARVIAVADITDALSAERPYREPLDRREVCRILGEESNAGALCAESVAAATEILSGSAGLPGSGCGLPN